VACHLDFGERETAKKKKEKKKKKKKKKGRRKKPGSMVGPGVPLRGERAENHDPGEVSFL